MAKPITITLLRSGLVPLFPRVQKRALNLRPIGRELARIMRLGGAGSVEEHFASTTEYLPRGGTQRWVPLAPATRTPARLKFGSKVMTKTTAYRQAWTGRGVGAVTRIEARRVNIGVNRARFPQVRLHQSDTIVPSGLGGRTRVPPRPINFNPIMLNKVALRVLRYVRTGR